MRWSILANGHYWWLIQTSLRLKKRYQSITLRWNFQHSTQLCTPFQKEVSTPIFHGLRLWQHFPHSTSPTLPLWQPKFIGFSIVNLWKHLKPQKLQPRVLKSTIVRILHWKFMLKKCEKNMDENIKLIQNLPLSNSTTQVTSDKQNLSSLTQLLY
jgi:hypothetical protein